WDTDQFPNNVPEVALAYYEVIRAGGFTTGGTNFDAKLRRQSLDPEDLILAHVGGFDMCARGYKAAAGMVADGSLENARRARYAGWDTADGQAMLGLSLDELAEQVEARNIQPTPRSGRQERLENLVSRYV
ncbi:MAG: xylose isomerase, partial [Pseudomonadota bacterium]